ncbi:Cellulose binding domain-containing protein [Anaerobium acetethylicum]|uniref:Cellulose binding domain-containing protein n=1 Tax=Anaerobium acetethylicum TaxID=1619234 RepID=A0A1D3TTQ4_9FIRM|nr:Cellulose binding domain-containing protein [Anaerobium acetethylicum]
MFEKCTNRGLALMLAIIMLVITCYSPEVYAANKKVINSSTYSGEGFEVIFDVTGSWSGAYNAKITIKNTADKNIENWCIAFPLQETISNIWNASIVDISGGYYKIKNMGWNQDIAIGTSVSFGFTASGDFSRFPNCYDIFGKAEEVSMDKYGVAYEIESDWGDGFNGKVTITNKSEKVIEDWCM